MTLIGALRYMQYPHPHKFVPMWHSAERFAPWCFIIIVMIERYEIKGGVTYIIIQEFVKWIKLKEETAAYSYTHSMVIL